jgi:ABC-2 type transport system permease protein
MDGEVWQGAFDFTLLRPAPTQFLVSVRKWRIAALLDVALALVVLGAAVLQMPARPEPGDVAAFAVALAAGMGVVYALLLTTAALVFWSPGLMSMWVFDGVFQLARYPLDLYPSWLQLALTWVVPVGLITTVPAEALRGRLEVPQLALLLVLAVALTIGASLIFRAALRRYASASS